MLFQNLCSSHLWDNRISRWTSWMVPMGQSLNELTASSMLSLTKQSLGTNWGTLGHCIVELWRKGGCGGWS